MEEPTKSEKPHRDGGAIADHAFGEGFLVAVKLQHVGPVGRTALGHDKDQVEDP